MTAEMLLVLMATMTCHTMTVDIPERRETVAQTACVNAVPDAPPKVTQANAKPRKATQAKKYYPKKKKYRSRRKKRA